MLIGLHGKKQAGKDTVYERIARIYGQEGLGATVERVSFADLLYESAAAALNIPVDLLRALKTEDAWITVYGSSGGQYESLTVRTFLQRYGTEAHRDVFGSNFWVEQVRPRLADHADKIVVVTDVRFPNEAEAVFNAGGKVIHVVGPAEVERAGDGHASEETLPHHQIDRRLHNWRRDDYFRGLDTKVRLLMTRLIREERDPEPVVVPHS